jgi:hypothetical protein
MKIAMRRMRSGCCARPASGRAVAPPSSVMNARRFKLIRANPLLTYAQKPRTETEEKTCSSERAKEAVR